MEARTVILLHTQGTIRALAVSNLELKRLRRMWPGANGEPALVRVPPHVYQGYANAYQSTDSADTLEGHHARLAFLEQRNVTLAPHSLLSAWPAARPEPPSGRTCASPMGRLAVAGPPSSRRSTIRSSPRWRRRAACRPRWCCNGTSCRSHTPRTLPHLARP